MRALIIASITLLCISYRAHALSCVQPTMTVAAVESSQAIFEGTLVEMKPEGLFDKVRRALIKDDLGRTRIFIFRVNRAWKGIQEDQIVEISRNTYWGPSFSVGEQYLVVAETKEYGVLNSALCGLSATLSHADNSIQFLKQHFSQ